MKKNSRKQVNKISIRFYNDREVRAIWDDKNSKWLFSVIDIISAINDSSYEKARNYWKYLKAKLKKEKNQLVSATNQLKLLASDGKKYNTDVFDTDSVVLLAKNFPNENAIKFLDWFMYSDNTIDGKSKIKAYTLFDSSILDTIKPGTIKGLQKIHEYLFGGLYDFAGKIRNKNISKGGFKFAYARYLDSTLAMIEKMPEKTYDEIIEKYVEMNVAHPFMEGNGRSTRIWLDLMLKKNLKKCVDWSKINKKIYLDCMKESVVNSAKLNKVLKKALTSKINDREVFMKGVDYSYYYEENE